jgi:hypothetical protein
MHLLKISITIKVSSLLLAIFPDFQNQLVLIGQTSQYAASTLIGTTPSGVPVMETIFQLNAKSQRVIDSSTHETMRKHLTIVSILFLFSKLYQMAIARIMEQEI